MSHSLRCVFSREAWTTCFHSSVIWSSALTLLPHLPGKSRRRVARWKRLRAGWSCGLSVSACKEVSTARWSLGLPGGDTFRGKVLLLTSCFVSRLKKRSCFNLTQMVRTFFWIDPAAAGAHVTEAWKEFQAAKKKMKCNPLWYTGSGWLHGVTPGNEITWLTLRLVCVASVYRVLHEDIDVYYEWVWLFAVQICSANKPFTVSGFPLDPRVLQLFALMWP